MCSNREQRRLRRGGGDSEQLSDLALLARCIVVRPIPDDGSKRSRQLHRRDDRRPGRRGDELVCSVETAFQTRDYVDWDLGQCLGSPGRFIPAGLGIGRVEAAWAKYRYRRCGTSRRSRALVGVGDHHPAPVLRVARGGRLHCELHAVEYHVTVDRPRQVQAFAHRPCGGEQFVDRGDVHRSDVDRTGLIDAEHGQRPPQAKEDGQAQSQVEDFLVAE